MRQRGQRPWIRRGWRWRRGAIWWGTVEEIILWSSARWSAASKVAMDFGDFVVGIGYGFEDTLAEIFRFVTVTEL